MKKKNHVSKLSAAIVAVLIIVISGSSLAASYVPGSLSYSDHVIRAVSPPQHWAVIVGISDYLYLNDLDYCDDDAQDMYNQLLANGWQAA